MLKTSDVFCDLKLFGALSLASLGLDGNDKAMEAETDLAGKLLIAMPGIGDDRFNGSVILVCAHTHEHAMGIVLNRQMDGLKLPDLLEQLDIPLEITLDEDSVLMGGPVSRDRGFVLHSDDFESEGATINVRDGMRLTATKEALHAIASKDGPRQSRLALGYSGWGPLQLEAELRENVWLVADADNLIVFDTDFDTKWRRSLAKLGISPDQLSGGAEGNA